MMAALGATCRQRRGETQCANVGRCSLSGDVNFFALSETGGGTALRSTLIVMLKPLFAARVHDVHVAHVGCLGHGYPSVGVGDAVMTVMTHSVTWTVSWLR